MKNTKIDIVSDVVCPWCYIGYNRLIQALKEANIDAEIRWVPFQLHPGIGEEGNDLHQFLEDKYKSPGAEQMNNIQKVASEDGLTLNADKVLNMPNTLKAHLIKQLAREKGLGNKMSEVFFEAYFVNGKDLNNLNTLLDLAVLGGLDRLEIKEYLDNGNGIEELAQEEERYKMEEGVWVVPAFIFNDDEMIEGAQTVEGFKKFFNDANVVLPTAPNCNDESCEI